MYPPVPRGPLKGPLDAGDGMEQAQSLDIAARIRAIHVPHSTGSRECSNRCEIAHWDVQVCNEDDHRWPCPTIRALDGD